MYKGLVSIVTPVYNGEEYIERYLKSILNQTYRPLQLILVNDGSKDNTEKIINSYKQKIEESNIEFHYIYQENAGQAVAVANGIKKVTGEYFVWPDSDDFYNNDTIAKFVEFMEENKDYSIVRSNANIVNEENINIKTGEFKPTKTSEELFEDYLVVNNNVYFCPGVFMIRFKDYLEVNPELYIYPSRGGQNWQILLPILYRKKCAHLDEHLYNYVVRGNSHSHASEKIDIIKKLEKLKIQEELLINTIEHMNMPENEEKKYKTIINNKFIKHEFELYFKEGSLEEIETALEKLKANKLLTVKTYLLYLTKKNSFFKYLYKIYQK